MCKPHTYVNFSELVSIRVDRSFKADVEVASQLAGLNELSKTIEHIRHLSKEQGLDSAEVDKW